MFAPALHLDVQHLQGQDKMNILKQFSMLGEKAGEMEIVEVSEQPRQKDFWERMIESKMVGQLKI